MKNIIVKGQTVLISLADLNELVSERERLARLDEIKRAKVHGYTAHLKRRFATLTGKEYPKKKRTPVKKLNIHHIDLGSLKDFSDIEQYIARR
jgi:hypothetical protein